MKLKTVIALCLILLIVFGLNLTAFASLCPCKQAAPTPAPVVEVKPKVFLKSIFFDFDKFNIRPDQDPSMRENLAYLKKYMWNYLVVKGHADARGSVDYNINLSRNRAQTIKDYLVANGIAADKIIVYPYGKDFPSKPGADEGSYAFERRIDLSVWDNVPEKMEALKKENNTLQ